MRIFGLNRPTAADTGRDLPVRDELRSPRALRALGPDLALAYDAIRVPTRMIPWRRHVPPSRRCRAWMPASRACASPSPRGISAATASPMPSRPWGRWRGGSARPRPSSCPGHASPRWRPSSSRLPRRARIVTAGAAGRPNTIRRCATGSLPAPPFRPPGSSRRRNSAAGIVEAVLLPVRRCRHRAGAVDAVPRARGSARPPSCSTA